LRSQRYEIFQKLPSQQAAWIESATSLDEAKTRLRQLTEMFPADYFFIFDRRNACFIVPQDDTAGSLTSRATKGRGPYVPPAIRRIGIPENSETAEKDPHGSSSRVEEKPGGHR